MGFGGAGGRGSTPGRLSGVEDNQAGIAAFRAVVGVQRPPTGTRKIYFTDVCSGDVVEVAKGTTGHAAVLCGMRLRCADCA